MCFKRLFSRKRNQAKTPARLWQANSANVPSRQALEALAAPMDSRPIREQILDFLHRAERPQGEVVHYRRVASRPGSGSAPSPGTEEPSSSLSGIPEEGSARGDVSYSLPKAMPHAGGQNRLPDEWQKEYLAWQAGQGRKQTFREFILDAIGEKGINPVSFYQAADIDRKLFSRMKNEPGYKPSKETAIRCCLALKLDIQKAEHALGLAGYSLSWSLREDLAIRWCIQHRFFRVYEVMEVVEELKESVH